MISVNDLKTGLTLEAINYFYTREKCDVYGNPRYRVNIIDPDGSAVYETIFKTYEGLIADHVKKFVEGLQEWENRR